MQKIPNAKYEEFKTWDPGMKFDVVVGNPPYQNGSNGKFFKQFLVKADQIAEYSAFVIPMSHFRDISNLLGVMVFKSLGDYFESVQMGVCFFVKKQDHSGSILLLDQFGNARVVNETTILCENLSDFDIAVKIIDDSSGFTIKTGQLMRREVTTGSQKCILSVGRKNSEFDYCFTDDIEKISGLGLHKVIASAAGDVTKLGNLKYADPSWGVGASAIFIEVSSQQEASNLIAYLESKLIRFIIKILKFGDFHNTKKLFRALPVVDLARTWTDEELYHYFGLTEEEIRYIEETVK